MTGLRQALPRALPQCGGCLCGEIRYCLSDAGLTLYACHCTDCQRQSGSAFSLSLLVRRASLSIESGQPAEYALVLPDGRRKRSQYCSRCHTRLFCPSRTPELIIVEAATLDDTSWLWPVAHIWTRSAQAWIRLPDDTLQFAKQPEPGDMAAFVTTWSERRRPADASG